MRIQIYQSSDDNYVCFSLTNCSRLKVGKPKYFILFKIWYFYAAFVSLFHVFAITSHPK